MGLLDEAIRQHLELKRQHGASDEELQMQEQEALGPVRREPVEPVAEPEEAEPDLEADEDLYEHASLDAEAEAAVYEDELPAAPEVYPEDRTAEADAPTDALGPDEAMEPDMAGDTPTRGFEAVQEPVSPEDALLPEDELTEDAEDAEDDVLEETPEFLQETPEHDRLWFEQQPPRDFDFDEE